MAEIHVLDKHTAELIAAGEVVERPASVVKELLENAIDAGASQITVSIESGGVRLIEISDNGTGIEAKYIPTAFIRHATSKIRTEDDLNSIHTLGFRGEALASIASVARVELLTRTEADECASLYRIEGGEEQPIEPGARGVGTTIRVRDLFFNTPARMKFLKKDSSEGTFVADPNTNRRGVRYSFTTEVSSLGKTPSSTLVDFGVIVPTRAICEKMELREGTSVYCFTRVRNVDGEPLILETSYYPQFIYPNLTREMVQTHSFYSLLYHVGITPFSAEDTYEAVMLDAPRANLLSVEPGSCAFYHQRRTKTEDGRVYEYTRSYIRGDRVRLDVHMQKSGMTFSRIID